MPSLSERKWETLLTRSGFKIYVKDLIFIIGGICGTTGVKAVDNFWGYASRDLKLSFKICPRGYCCGVDAKSCTTYNTCAIGRRGTLCGTCAKGFKQNFIGSNCIPKGKPCDLNVFVTYFLVYTTVYTLVFILITNIKTIIKILKWLITKKQSTLKNKEGESEIGNDDTFSLAGFVQIVILFFQVAGLLSVKFHSRGQQEKSTSKRGVQDSLTDIFNFRFFGDKSQGSMDSFFLSVQSNS